MTKDQNWIHQHFEELVDKYAGQYVAVANEEPFLGESPKEARRNALSKYPTVNPSVLRVPRPEDFVCAL